MRGMASVVAITDTNAYVLDSTLRLQTMFRGHAQIELSSFTPSGSLVLGTGVSSSCWSPTAALLIGFQLFPTKHSAGKPWA
jgi:hypothetical protein